MTDQNSDNETLSRPSKVENTEFNGFVRRILRAYGRRVGQADPTALRDLVAARAAVDSAMDEAVQGLRDAGFSWTEIGRELNVSKQAARQRWGV